MKTERLLAITLHLLDSGKPVTAAKLAERFGVARRTILRDMDEISAAGVPITSTPGSRGGYSVMEGYRIDGRIVTKDDMAAIAAALKGMSTSYEGEKFADTLKKINISGQNERRVFLDFGASGENSEIQGKLKQLEMAASNKKAVRIVYVNAIGGETDRVVEPVALNYRWYAWYLLAYCRTKQDYRVFKLARISQLEDTGDPFKVEHGEPEELLEQGFSGAGRRELDVTLQCKAAFRVQICEYLDGYIAETLDNSDFIMRLTVLDDERMWFGMLMSFGDAITVLEPESLRERVQRTAQNILDVYGER